MSAIWTPSLWIPQPCRSRLSPWWRLPFHAMAHLKKGPSGHLMKTSSGHLSKGCSGCPAVSDSYSTVTLSPTAPRWGGSGALDCHLVVDCGFPPYWDGILSYISDTEYRYQHPSGWICAMRNNGIDSPLISATLLFVAVLCRWELRYVFGFGGSATLTKDIDVYTPLGVYKKNAPVDDPCYDEITVS